MSCKERLNLLTKDVAMSGRRILIVGDIEEQVEDLQQLLEDQGHRVLSVSNTMHAVESCMSFRPHLVVLDLILPGTELLCLTRQLMMCNTDPSPTVLVTSNLPHSFDPALNPGVSSGIFALERFNRSWASSTKSASNRQKDWLH
jgi:CheY-like chemotaxis protein